MFRCNPENTSLFTLTVAPDDVWAKKLQIITTSFRWRSLSCLFLWMVVSLVTAGCSRDKFATVEGVATLDGKNLDGGSVTFSPNAGGPLSYGNIATDGSFHLQTASIQGVVPGEYVATVSYRRGRPSPGMSDREIEALEKVPVRYCKQNTSDLRFDVKPGHNSLGLKMASK
jgi:hypothetical protein